LADLVGLQFLVKLLVFFSPGNEQHVGLGQLLPQRVVFVLELLHLKHELLELQGFLEPALLGTLFVLKESKKKDS
jgi:hypothetical protein